MIKIGGHGQPRHGAHFADEFAGCEQADRHGFHGLLTECALQPRTGLRRNFGIEADIEIRLADAGNVGRTGTHGRHQIHIDAKIAEQAGDFGNIIAVAATTSAGGLASYSQYGATTVDIGAPGSGIVSTVPVAQGKGKNATVGSGYASYNGTSMATPHVTGAVALYAARNPGASAAQIKAAIYGTATPTPSLQGKVSTNGRLNVESF